MAAPAPTSRRVTVPRLPLRSRLMWFALLWLGGVASVAAIGLVIKLMLQR